MPPAHPASVPQHRRPLPLRVGTRASPLALWQTRDFLARVTRFCPVLRAVEAFEEQRIETSGDLIQDRRLAEIGQRYVDGTARPTDPKLVADLADDCAAGALCDHERLAASPLRSAMRFFGPEIDDHILRGVCPAGICSPIRLPAAAGGR